MIHVLNFKDEIIDFISQNDKHIIQANHKRNINDRSETFDFTILSKRTEHLKERNRIIIQDSNKQYREFIIEHISSDIDGYTTIESSASYLQDIATAKPLAPMKLEKMTTMQALKEVLKDTGWEASDETEYGGTRTTSWTSYNTKYEVLLQLCTTYDMMLDFYIELDSNTVKHRYVTLKKRNALFKGKEITYGKDLLGLKRTVDLSSIKTALLCISPEDDKGQRIVLEVHDDEAQERFGLPKRYIWDVYEPESSDDKMTEARLRTLGTTELNKRKVEIISYEVSSLDIRDSQPHEVVYLGDKVRIKNRDFTPALYVEAEVIGEEYDLIAKESNYLFGQYKEYREEDLRKAFEKRLSDIRTKLNDSISNVNTIVQETLNTELQYFEKKIIKSATPPENAVNDVLWLDTSNPNVPILKRYWEGQWIKASVDNAEDIGGITREKALFSELNNTFINLTIQHSRLLNEMHEVMNSEYLVDEDIKASLNSNLDKTVSVFNNIKTNLDSMTEDTATIGKLVDIQALFLKYREQLQALYKVVEQAKLSIDARFKLLQAQYTDEKFNEAMENVAKTLPNGRWNADTKILTSDVPNQDKLDSIVNDLKLYVNNQDNTLETKIGKSVDAKIVDTKNEFTRQFTEVNSKVDGIEIGGRNLLKNSKHFAKDRWLNYQSSTIETIKNENYYNVKINGGSNLIKGFYMVNELKENYVNEFVTLSIKIKNNGSPLVLGHNWLAKQTDNPLPKGFDGIYHYSGYISSYAAGQIQFRTEKVEDELDFDIYWVKIEKGNKATDWTPAPEDTDKSINDVKVRVETVEGGLTATNKKFETVYSKTETEKLLNSSLEPIKTDVNSTKSSIEQLDKEIKSKVSQTIYTTDQANVVKRLNSADTERQQLSNQIADRVTITKYNNGIEAIEQNTDQKLTTMKTEIIQDGKKISQEVSQQIYNVSSKTLNQTLSQYINSISTGHQFTYDENGNITSFIVGPNGIKLNAKVIDMNDGDVIIKNGVTTISDAYIPKLFSKQATIEYLKARDIDLNKATVSGSSEGETTVLSGGKIRSTGTFTRTFPEGSATYESYTESWNGTYRSGLISKTSGGKKQTGITRWLSLNDKSVTTQREIHSASPDKNGARFIDFFAEETFGSDVTGQGMHVYSGQALKIESEYGLYLNANKRFYIRTEDSGLEINKDGQNLVLKRTSPYNSTAGSGGSYMSIQSSDGVEQGHVGILSNNRHLSLKSSYGEVLLKGSKVFALDADGVNRVQMYAQYFSGEKIIGNIEAADTNIYAMCHDELRVVSKAGYNNGDPNYKNIRFGSWNAMSHEKYKHDIKAWDYNVLDIYRNDLLLHSYKVNSEKDSTYYRIHHGIILRENSNLDQFPVEWRNGDGFDGNEVLWWNTKAVQELAHENTDLKNRVNDLENRLKTLEDKLNEQKS
ncbi:phage tail spike protein [Macrococcus sp. S115]|uniref:phage tail spike protein n=1 Tax=Macrococcus sp. S115 TaxID=3047480 RepID=UPI0024BCE3D7|nr:phage tail spike protein [Macrococcus sp. S115]MDJ1111424.1 phage tail spike protein [Macrococcus sp. S115]